MAPMKAMKAKATMKAMKSAKLMSKGALATELADAAGLKKGELSKVLDALAEIGSREVKKNGKFTLPGLCMIKTRKKKATKGGKRMMFGKEVKVKPQPAKTVVKAFPVAALKQQIWSGSLPLVAPWEQGALHQILVTEHCHLYILCLLKLECLFRCVQPRWACKLPVWTLNIPRHHGIRKEADGCSCWPNHQGMNWHETPTWAIENTPIPWHCTGW